MTLKELRKQAQEFARHYFKAEMPAKYVFHSVYHTEEVVAAAKELSADIPISNEERVAMEIALWFHDLGYGQGGHENHEERSAELAVNFLTEAQAEPDFIELVRRLILVTRRDTLPETMLEQIIKDADTHHIGTKSYMSKLGLLRSEWETEGPERYEEKHWLKLNLDFLQRHEFRSPVGKSMYNGRKRKNILKLQKQLQSLIEFEEQSIDVDVDSNAPERIFPKRADRGVETMFRVTLRNHNNLSRIADNKANIMLSINAIMLSIVISSLTPKLDANPRLIIPTIMLIVVCMISIIMATLSTRPKVSSAKYSDEKFLSSKFNLLFFGNFMQLPIDKFEWGIGKLMNDERLLYSSLSKDLYYLGLVLGKKYKYLWICYNIFMIGLGLTAIAFIYAFATTPPNI
ncbi:MAG: HD domain-containing protein [Saprospiraceae bacterium]|nr:HD domain-containing protein [Saprospiraceae bacterium]